LTRTAVSVGYSPCPNDTFLFYALVHGQVDTEGCRFEPVLADVEALNRWALEGRLPMTKASFGVPGQVRERYWCLRSGTAVGWGCASLVVARGPCTIEELSGQRVAAPGLHTTANLLLLERAGPEVKRVPMAFHEIMPAVARGDVEAGVILVAVEDLGAWWEGRTGLPVPLGCILLRREAPAGDPAALQRVLRRSVQYALAHPEEPMDYVRAHAQELDEAVIRQHIALYMNAFSVDLGDMGERAVGALLGRSVQEAPGSASLFPDGRR
jgi:1,4-dihydroxy-6-naphthoate synthase